MTVHLSGGPMDNHRTYEVHGTVRGRHGEPLRHARVVAWWQRLRGKTELAGTEASEHGRYELAFRLPEDAPEPVLIVVEALSEYLEAPLFSPLTKAQPELVIDLSFEPSDQSEWATLGRSIEPLLDGLTVAELVEDGTHQDISFLARELGAAPETVMQVAVAARLEAAFGVTAPAFYAFLRQRIPAALPSPLLDASDDFTLIGPLVQSIGSQILSLTADTQTQALTGAVALDLIGPQYTTQVAQLVSQLQALRSTDLLSQPYLVGSTTLGELLDVAALSPAKQQSFATALAAGAPSMRDFWRTLGDGTHGLSAAEASSVERTLSVGAIVKNFVPLVQDLVEGFASGTYKTVPDLAQLSLKDWVTLIGRTGAPPSIDAAAEATPVQVFASVVYARVTRAYPTAALSGRIAAAALVPKRQQAPLARFFQNNPDLELVKHNIPAWLESHADTALAGISEKDRQAVVASARVFQRVLRVAPDPDTAQALLGLGLTSATEIAGLGEQQFFTRATAAGLTRPEANAAYQAAAQRYAGVVSLYTQLNRDVIGVWPNAVGRLANLDQPVQEALRRDPSLATLFGSQDYCATDDCTSVLSPAAYLCDLLLWLRNHQQGAQTALDVLDGRRPDIRHLLLDCPNTDTELPYIDLVNELLADAISPPPDPGTDPRNPKWKQTSDGKTATQLSAAPEYFNSGAYATLATASYPFTLPYSAGLDELRGYLGQLKLPRWQLGHALLPLSGTTTAQRAAVAAERFGLTPHGTDLMVNPDFVPAPVAWNTPDPLTDVAPVDGFLAAASLSYESLLELLQAAWVQGGLGVAIQGVDDTCMTATQSLTPLVGPDGLAFLDRAHRFLRLWLAAGYKMWELDLLLGAPAVGNGTLDAAALTALLSFRQLQDATGLAVDQQVAFYQDIDTGAHRDPDGTTAASLYARVFLNPAVTAVAPDPDLAALVAGGAIADPVLADHLAGIQAALAVAAADAALLFGLTDNTLTLANLSLIYRVSALATAAKLSVSDLLALAGLLDPAAGGGAAALAQLLSSPAATLAFLAQATVVRQQASLTPDALTYMLTPPDATGGWPTTSQLTQADIAAVLGAVRQAVSTLLSASTTLAAPINDTQTSVTVTSSPGFPAPNFSVAIGTEILLVTAVGGTGDTTWTVARGQQGTTAAPAASGTAVTPAGGDVDGAAIAAVAASAHHAATAGLANDVSALIMGQLKVPGTGLTLLAVLTDPAFTGASDVITPAAWPQQFTAVQLFDKAAILVRGLRLVANDLSWLLANAAAYGGLDLTGLPVTAAQPALGLPPLLTTFLLVKLARLWTAAAPSAAVQTLYDVIAGVAGGALADADQAQAALATVTGWPLADIGAYTAALGFAFPATYTAPTAYDALRTLEAMAVTAGATGSQLVGWGAQPADEAAAESAAAGALGVVKAAQPGDDAWLALAATLMNPVREHRSAALQAHLTAQRDAAGDLLYPDADALFDYFLIDVQMSSCQVTSRVVQAYIAVQTFVERCLMNLEAPAVVVDLTKDDTWTQWEWMSRYRVWEANREVFLYPENWLIESQRPSRTEIYQQLEQEIRQGQSTTDYLETVVLNYIDRFDGLAHLLVTGTCEDPVSGSIYVVARTLADPPSYYLRSFTDGAWTGWAQIPLDIKAYQVVPALYRGRVCLFWLDVKVANEPQQSLPAAQQSAAPPSQTVDRYVSLGVNFSMFRNGSWSPTQAAKGKLFDKPFYDPSVVADSRTVAGLYTIKVQTPAAAPGYGANLFIDVFRLGDFQVWNFGWLGDPSLNLIIGENEKVAVHLGRAVFNGRFSDLELRNLEVPAGAYAGQPLQLLPSGYTSAVPLLAHAQAVYGPDAQPLLPLADGQADPDLVSDSGLVPQAGALATPPGGPATLTLNFTSAGALEQNAGPLLYAAPAPLRIVGPVSDLNFAPAAYFFFQDNRRSYWVQAQKTYWTGSFWSPVAPSDPATAPYQVHYQFHPFYHPFTGLFWNQLAGGGFDLLYDPHLQQAPDNVDPSLSDVFSFRSAYQPSQITGWDLADAGTTLAAPVSAAQTTVTVTDNIWIPGSAFYVSIGSETLLVTGVTGADGTTWTVVRGQQGTTAAAAAADTPVTPLPFNQDRQFLDFSYPAPFAVYNWELFYHIPLYIAQLLSQNQQFDDARTWFQYIFDPTRAGSTAVPQRFWIPKPLRDLTSAEVLSQQVSNLLVAVNQGDPAAVAQVNAWRNDPFNPFLLADQRPVAYMKSAVMSYLDNLIAEGDNLFSTESREALGEATLLYVIAAEILGPAPIAVTPPAHADESFDQLEPALDAFANAMVEIENVIGGAGGTGGSGGGGAGGLPVPQTFYFKVPSNAQLLGYWGTVADRLYKLRHCQNIAGASLELALFDAPIDPGLLIAAQAAGVDLSSVLSDVAAAVPNYRFTALYPQALDFVNAVRAYGTSLQAALQQGDAGALALLQQTTAQQLLTDGNDVLDWQVQQAQANIDALNEALALNQQKKTYNNDQGQELANLWEWGGMTGKAAAATIKTIAAALHTTATVVYLLPEGSAGVNGAGGTPQAGFTEGGKNAGDSSKAAGFGLTNYADVIDAAATIATTIGGWVHRQDASNEAATEADIQIAQTQAQIDAATFALQIAQQNQVLHQEQIDNAQKQIDFLNSKFTSDSLYDWMTGTLSATYFQSYHLAYQLCKQLERCYQYELGISDSSFIHFGYWDSLHKGLLAGETLNHDLRRMQASYLQQNSRRYELSRYVSLGQLSPAALQQLLVTGACDFELPESLFDGDYPGHYNRRLTRVSLTVVYPSPGKFDNVKATLTLTANKVRVSTDTSTGYAENPGSDPRFVYNYGAVPQKIAMGNAQDDPGLFITAIASNIADQRYLPFENAGAVSSWHLDMHQQNNEIDIATVGDVVLHLFYTAMDGGTGLQEAAGAAAAPTSGVKLFSAQNDFTAPAPTAANPYPVTPWQAFLATVAAPASQTLTLSISPSKFPPWTRGKTITVTSLTVLAVAWPPGNFVLAPQAPFPAAPVTMTPVAGVTEPNVCAATITPPDGVPLGTWSFELQRQGAADFRSLTKNDVGDVVLLVSYEVS